MFSRRREFAALATALLPAFIFIFSGCQVEGDQLEGKSDDVKLAKKIATLFGELPDGDYVKFRNIDKDEDVRQRIRDDGSRPATNLALLLGLSSKHGTKLEELFPANKRGAFVHVHTLTKSRGECDFALIWEPESTDLMPFRGFLDTIGLERKSENKIEFWIGDSEARSQQSARIAIVGSRIYAGKIHSTKLFTDACGIQFSPAFYKSIRPDTYSINSGRGDCMIQDAQSQVDVWSGNAMKLRQDQLIAFPSRDVTNNYYRRFKNRADAGEGVGQPFGGYTEEKTSVEIVDGLIRMTTTFAVVPD